MLQRDVAGGGRLDAPERLAHIVRGDHLLRDEVGQVVFFGVDIHAEVEVLRVHAAHVQVGDVAHGADGYSGIEGGELLVAGMGERVQPLVPLRGVVVFRVESLAGALLKQDRQLDGLARGLVVPDPGKLPVALAVEDLHRGSVIGEVGPVQLAQPSFS